MHVLDRSCTAQMSVHSVMVRVINLLLLLSVTATTRAEPVMDHEPVEHLKAHLPKDGDDISNKMEALFQLPHQELTRKTAQMENNLRKLLKSEAHVSAFLVKESSVVAQRAAAGIQFNSSFLLPHSISLSILSTTLPILLEGYKRELLTKPVGDVLKGNHRSHGDIKDYLSLSLHDLVTKLPTSGDSVDLTEPALLSGLNRRGRAALFYLNTVLESVAEDAWKDALISVAMDHSAFGDNGQMITHFKDLTTYADILCNDLVSFYEVSKSDLLPLDGGHYLYGWWFNCPRGRKGDRESTCLAPFLPSDSIAVFHRAVRLYSIPRLSLHLVVGNSGAISEAPQTLADVLRQDRQIWEAIFSVVDPSSSVVREDKTEDAGAKKQEVPTTEQTKKADTQKAPPQQTQPDSIQEDEVVGESAPPRKSGSSESGQRVSSPPVKREEEEDEVVEGIPGSESEGDDGEKTLLVRAIYGAWPVSVFIFYVILGHVWVYWLWHLAWVVLSSIFSGIHLPRPKTAKQD